MRMEGAVASLGHVMGAYVWFPRRIPLWLLLELYCLFFVNGKGDSPSNNHAWVLPLPHPVYFTLPGGTSLASGTGIV